MSSQIEIQSMAVFCDFENIAIGAREAQYDQFDINKVMERLLIKGSIVVKKAYCDWERYKEFKTSMHEASFELIEIPHIRQSGKNSADIRMVVDALDLCYTKAHVDTFVIISGDSDFSPLVSKLRENNKFVIGVGVKMSTSELLIANCDEFIYYDDLVRRKEKQNEKKKQIVPRRNTVVSLKIDSKSDKDEDDRMQIALDIVGETVEELISERGEDTKLWASMVKQAIKRRNPGFNETYYGFRTFSKLLEEAGKHQMIELALDPKSGGYVIKGVAHEE